MSSNSDRVIISSSIFIVTFMLLDSILNDEIDIIPSQAMNGLILVTMLASLEFVGLGRIAGPFAALIAGTVFLSRGERIFSKLVSISAIEDENTSELQMGTRRNN